MIFFLLPCMRLHYVTELSYITHFPLLNSRKEPRSSTNFFKLTVNWHYRTTEEIYVKFPDRYWNTHTILHTFILFIT